MITPETYAIYRAACDRANEWIGDKRSWVTADAPAYVADVTNYIRAEVEEYETHRDKPRYVTLYVTPWGNAAKNGKGQITGWTGIPYGSFVVTRSWYDRHHNLRCQIRANLLSIGEYTGQWCTCQQCVNLRLVKRYNTVP